MNELGTPEHPLRVAVIGSGPAAFYATEHLFKQTDLTIEVDMFDRLPTPYGLVRGGVAPDHMKIKSVTNIYDKIASNPRFRFFGNVEFGNHMLLADFRAHYHQILFANGAQSDRRMGIPGEDLKNSYAATEFVAWYNGHPDYQHYDFDLSAESIAVIGVGNVAIDVARVLCRSPKELEQTDISPRALEALSQSRVKTVYLLGRRGPAQAAFTNPEVKELDDMEVAEVVIRPEEAALDDASKASIANDRAVQRKVEMLQAYAARTPEGAPKQLRLRFLVSPVELIGDEQGRVKAMKLVKNKLVADDKGNISAKATDESEVIEVGLVFRSVGYRGVPLPDIPFNDKTGTIWNEKGRVIDPNNKAHLVGQYATGWIKRGPSGVIGTNKPDAVETVELMIEDAKKAITFEPPQPTASAALNHIRSRQKYFVSFNDWKTLDAIEVSRGQAIGRPRLKFTNVQDMLEALEKEKSQSVASGG
jgi:ferredoxin--NADP+ reductase